MATFRNDSGHDLTIPRFGLYVADGDTFEVAGADADSLAAQPTLVRTDAHDEPAAASTDAPAEPTGPSNWAVPAVAETAPATTDAVPAPADALAAPADAQPATVDAAPATDDAAGTPAVEAAPAEQAPAAEVPAVDDVHGFTL